MKKLLAAAWVFLASAFAATAAEPILDIVPDQMSRLLQLTIAQANIDGQYSHKCWQDQQDNEYDCQDKIADVLVLYFSDDENARVTRVAIAAQPRDFSLAANLGGAIMVLAGEGVKAGKKAKNHELSGPASIAKAKEQFQAAFLNGMGFYFVGNVNALFTQSDDRASVIMHILHKPN